MEMIEMLDEMKKTETPVTTEATKKSVKTGKIYKSLTFYYTVTHSYKFSYGEFRELEETKDLTDEQKKEAWKALCKESVRGEIEVDNWADIEEADYDDVEEGILDYVEIAMDKIKEKKE
jgi:hypothetical protein